MKALTVLQPWASLLAIRAKRIETRGWWTHHRGLVAIHAGKRFRSEDRDLVEREPFWSCLRAVSLHQYNLPLGAVVGVARLVAVREVFHTRAGDVGLGGDPRALHPLMRQAAEVPAITGTERQFGDYRAGRFAWVLEDMVGLAEPIPARGAQGLWEWEPPMDSPVVVRSLARLRDAAERLP